MLILVVKTSLALSLGFVGALSIIRFRTPIKEPEELIYLFLSIGLGLGYGANQTLITISIKRFSKYIQSLQMFKRAKYY